MSNETLKIQQLNDNFRRTLSGDFNLQQEEITKIISMVQVYKTFTQANDPYNEHDFGSISYKGNNVFWKIDYYDTNYCYHSPDPSNKDLTKRVLTIMFALEY